MPKRSPRDKRPVAKTRLVDVRGTTNDGDARNILNKK